MPEPLELEPLNEEMVLVGRRRYQEALDAGLSVAESLIFADNGEDIGLFRKAVAAGCDPVRLAAIFV